MKKRIERPKQLNKYVEDDLIAEVQLYEFTSQGLFFIIDRDF